VRPHQPNGFTHQNLIALVDRELYPAAEHPAGQWDYMLFDEERFEKARAAFERNVANTVKVLFRRGSRLVRIRAVARRVHAAGVGEPASYLLTVP